MKNEKSLFNKADLFTIGLLRVVVALFLFSATIFLFYFTIDKYVYPSGSNNSSAIEQVGHISNDTLLALLSLLIAFAGLLAYIFHHLVKDSIHKELKDMACDERNASNAETRLSSSNIFSKLHEMTEEIENNTLKNNKKQEDKCKNDPCKVYNVFKSNDFLNTAVRQDELAMLSIKKIINTDYYKDTYIKVLNNRSYNLYLKYKESRELTHEEKLFILKAKHEIRKFIIDEKYHLYENITPGHIKTFENTCHDIDLLASSSEEWKDLQEEMTREFIKDC